MSYFEKHIQKSELFKKDAENETVSDPTRINAYFEAAFHCSRQGYHTHCV